MQHSENIKKAFAVVPILDRLSARPGRPFSPNPFARTGSFNPSRVLSFHRLWAYGKTRSVVPDLIRHIKKSVSINIEIRSVSLIGQQRKICIKVVIENDSKGIHRCNGPV